MNLKLLFAGLFLIGCTHEVAKLEVVADVRLGQTYRLVNQEQDKLCTVVPSNLITVLPVEGQLLSTESIGTEGLICGMFDCSAQQGDQGFNCTTFEAIKGQPVLSPKKVDQ